MEIIWLLIAGVIVAGIVVVVRKVKLCDAHVYKHLENGELLYCDAKQATHRDYQYLGTSKVKCDRVNRCSLA